MRVYRTALCLVLVLGFSSVIARGQTALPTAFRQQVAFTDQDVKTIDTWIGGQVQRLTGTEVLQQTSARETLVAGGNGSAPYAEAYAKSLDAALTPVIKGTDFRARLNAAIIVARVAEKTKSPALHDITMLLIGDKNEGMVLWGVKAARYVVPAIYAAQGASAKPDMIDAVSQAAGQWKESGPIVAEAYQVLAPQLTGMASPGPLVKATLKPLLTLMAARNKEYIAGVPVEPTAENTALLFVSLGPVWGMLSPAEQAGVMQQISDLVGLAGERWVTASRVDQEHLTPLLQLAGKALSVLGQPAPAGVNSQELITAGVNLAKVNSSLQSAVVQQMTAAVYPLLTKVPAFSALTAPPAVTPAAAGPTTKAAQ
ncbi:MAG TPA: hypothetical protein VFE58_19425 [Tepidisphaeraceae bacterium]|nr:hypothetical protein [Tepidisphaeraceae bacterium]